jgi:hypothetical protein
VVLCCVVLCCVVLCCVVLCCVVLYCIVLCGLFSGCVLVLVLMLVISCRRAHRDDQSAFTFLIAKYFGYGGHSIQQVYLDDYVGAYWRQRGS